MWHLEFSYKADKQLSKMAANTRRIIVSWLLKNIDGCENPRAHGKGLAADHSGEWRYRIGDYRVLCDIQDAKLVVLAFNIEQRGRVYKR
jgi:mRNA interferase RelE/StbE